MTMMFWRHTSPKQGLWTLSGPQRMHLVRFCCLLLNWERVCSRSNAYTLTWVFHQQFCLWVPQRALCVFHCIMLCSICLTCDCCSPIKRLEDASRPESPSVRSLPSPCHAQCFAYTPLHISNAATPTIPNNQSTSKTVKCLQNKIYFE